ncbi:MAG: FtsH protease activity modulator HflK, partial [Clostridiaceae bacterium]|nr:FtsH protease activity modulator HflK [Clostridiaceae bacterium]
MIKNISKYLVVIIIILVLFFWLSSGFYTIKSGEEAVILRLGKYKTTVSTAGLNWHMPSPIETANKVNVLEVKRLEFGYRTLEEGSHKQVAIYGDVPASESLMLTGDENMVNVETAIQYKITNAVDYFFNVKEPEQTLRIAAESAIRRVIANNILDEVLTENKFEIQQEIMNDLQKICDDYRLGVTILAVQLQDVYPPDEVDAAFKDVANAREDRNSYVNEAESY